MSERTYDQRCWDLAEHFVDDELRMRPGAPKEATNVRANLIHRLALEIQAAVEDFWAQG